MDKIVILHNTTHYLHLHYSELLSALQEYGLDVVVAAPRDRRASSLERRGIRCIDLRLSQHGMNPAREIQSIVAVGRVLWKERPDVLLNFSIKPVIYGSLAARLLSIPRVCSVVTGLGYVFIEGGAVKRLLKRLVIGLYRLSLPGNVVMFFQNRHDEQVFLRNGIVRECCCCVVPGTGIDTEAYRPSTSSPGVMRFVMATRLIAEKGIREYAACARKLRREYPNVEFLLAGSIDRNPTSISANELKQWSSEKIIEYVGSLEDIRPLLHRSSVLVLPSYYREGLPRSLIEAMACGLPVITTDWPGCRDCVEDGVNGLLVRPKDVRSLECAMRRFLEHPELVKAMGENARELAVREYSVDKVNARMMERIVGSTTALGAPIRMRQRS